MEKRARLHPDVHVVSPPAAFFEADELRDDELDQAVGGLERAWIPGHNDEARASAPA